MTTPYTEVRAGRVLQFQRGHSSSEVPLNNSGIGTPYLRTSDLMYGLPADSADRAFAEAPPPRAVIKTESEPVATIEGFVRGDGKSTIGIVCWAGEGLLNNHCVKVGTVDLSRLDLRFAQFAAFRDTNMQLLVTQSRGAISQSAGHALEEFTIPLPPVEEQRRIADFLDDQVARIDGVLADCRELDSHSEQAFQSAVIERTTYAVTGGTIATTGLPWKPFAESSWHIRPMRSFLRYAKDPVGEQWKDYLLLSLTKQGVIPRDVESNFGKFPESFDTYQAVEPGDLVMCLFDVDETPRTVGLTHERGMVTGAYTRFVWTDPEVSGRFVEYSLIGIDDQKAFRPLYTGMRKGIQTGRFLSARLPIPSNATQLSVVKELDERRHNMELFRTENARRSGLLEERKRALITAAVTGELDVTTARPIGMGKWVPNVGAEIERPVAVRTLSGVGGIE